MVSTLVSTLAVLVAGCADEAAWLCAFGCVVFAALGCAEAAAWLCESDCVVSAALGCAEAAAWLCESGCVVSADRPGARPVQTRDEAQQRRLPAAGGADDRDDLPGAQLEVEGAQHLVAALRGREGAVHGAQAHAVGGAASVGGRRVRRTGRARAGIGVEGGAGHGPDYDGVGRAHARIAS